jgi:hypothetical protein
VRSAIANKTLGKKYKYLIFSKLPAPLEDLPAPVPHQLPHQKQRNIKGSAPPAPLLMGLKKTLEKNCRKYFQKKSHIKFI